MKNTLTILKAMAWGLLLLGCMLIAYFSSWIAYHHVKDIKSAEDLKQAVIAYENIKDRSLKLEQLVKTGHRKSDEADKLEREIIQIIYKCKLGCDYPQHDVEGVLPYFSTLSFMDDDYKYAYTITLSREYLERISNPEQVRDYNNAVYSLILFGFLNVIVVIYELVALSKYSKIKASGVIIITFLLAPIVTSLSIMTTFKVFDEVHKFILASNNDAAVYGLVFAFLSFFIIYPPVFLICKNKGISIKNAVLLRG